MVESVRKRESKYIIYWHMYEESRKIEYMILFAKQKQRLRSREQMDGHQEETWGGVGGIGRVRLIHLQN